MGFLSKLFGNTPARDFGQQRKVKTLMRQDMKRGQTLDIIDILTTQTAGDSGGGAKP